MEVLENADIFLLENLSEFKEEVANCSKFAQMLSSRVDIFVNDCFSHSHKILASTVGVARFCHSCVAGFHFEESLCQLKKVAETSRNPYVAVVSLCCCIEVLNYFLNSAKFLWTSRSLETFSLLVSVPHFLYMQCRLEEIISLTKQQPCISWLLNVMVWSLSERCHFK